MSLSTCCTLPGERGDHRALLLCVLGEGRPGNGLPWSLGGGAERGGREGGK